jgi:glycosyltransferase involved in cell wall biosynthesis
MACGTPVLAFNEGSVPEVIDDGISGVIVNSIEEAVAAYPELVGLDRRMVRKTFDERFSAARMAQDYVSLYRSLLAKGANGKGRTHIGGPAPDLRAVHGNYD